MESCPKGELVQRETIEQGYDFELIFKYEKDFILDSCFLKTGLNLEGTLTTRPGTSVV